MKLNTQRPRSSAPNYSSNNILTPAGREPNQARCSPMCTHTHTHTPDLVITHRFTNAYVLERQTGEKITDKPVTEQKFEDA